MFEHDFIVQKSSKNNTIMIDKDFFQANSLQASFSTAKYFAWSFTPV